MAEANTSSTQQSFDAQQMDNQAMEQAPAGEVGEARADAPVATQSTGQPDGPSLLNNTTNPTNSTAEQSARGADSALGTGETASNPRDGGANANNNSGGPRGENAGVNPTNLTATAAAAEAAPQQDGGGQNNGGQNGVSNSAANAPGGRSGAVAGNVNAGNGANAASGEAAGNAAGPGAQTGPSNPSPAPANATNPATTPIAAETATQTADNAGGGGGTPNDLTENPDNPNTRPSATPVTVSFNPNSQTIQGNTTAEGNVLRDDGNNGFVNGVELTVSSFNVEGQTYQAGEIVTLDGVGTLSIAVDGSYVFQPNNGFNGNVPPVFYSTNFGAEAGEFLSITVTPAVINYTANITVANDVLVNTPDSIVFEAGLPTGSNAAGNTETDTGSFSVSASDGIKEIVVGGTTFSLAQLKAINTTPVSSVNTGEGTLQITSYTSANGDESATVGYAYTLDAAQIHDQLTADINMNDGVSITVNGIGGSTDSDTLNIRIVDDLPTATNDGTKTLTEDSILTVSGNALSNDGYGADGTNASVATAFSWDTNTEAKAELAKYGTLTLDGNGDYAFTLNNTSAAVQGLTSADVKTQELSYTITDADGDTSTQRVTITIAGDNDKPLISAIEDQDFGNVQEDNPVDGLYTATGQFSSDDIDLKDGLTWTFEGPSSEYGSMSVDQTGKWTYTLNNDSIKVQDLAADESFDEIYTIKVTDENGAFDTKEVTIIISGDNDAPVITAFVDPEELNLTSVTTGGQFFSSDIDNSDFATADWSIVGSDDCDCEHIDDIVSVNSLYGSMSVERVSGEWTYTLDSLNTEIQALAIGESINDIFTITVTDEKGAVDSKELTIIIQGTGNVPIISEKEAPGNVQEDVKLTSIGQFISSDVDLASAVWSVVDGPDSIYGSMAVDSKTGKWTYTLNNSEQVQALAADESDEEIYTIQMTDGIHTATQAVTITIAGNNDRPVISATTIGQDVGRVQEDKPVDGVYIATGQFTSSDVDFLFKTATWSVVGSGTSYYGSIEVDETGKWTYTLNNDSSEVQALSAGESIKDVFTIAVTDEKGAVGTKDVTISIFGTSDKITGSAGIDLIYAGAGEETVIGGGSADILTGGTGADLFQYTSTSDLTTTPGTIEKITDFSSVDGDTVDFASLLSSATNLTNTIKIDPTDGSSSHNLVSISIGGSNYLMDVNNANPGAGLPSSFYTEIDSQALLGNPALGTQASWTDVVDMKSATGFLGDTGIDSITGDGWTLKVLDAGVTYQATDVGGTSTMEFFRGANKATDVNVQITTSDGVVHDVNNADKITWHG